MHVRGVHQRNRAILEILHHKLPLNGVLYFADDDNTYDCTFLDKIRWTKTVAFFNVGLIGGYEYEGPIVVSLPEGHKIVGWKTPWHDKRKFPIDMAGFSINLEFMLTKSLQPIEYLLFDPFSPKASFIYR